VTVAPPDESPDLFALRAGTEGGPDVLSAWIPAAASPAEAVSFDAGRPVRGKEFVWRANLPASHDPAAARLSGAEAKLENSRAALVKAGQRLTAYVAAQAAGPSFARVAEAGPEQELSRLLGEIRTGAPAVGTYGVGDWAADGLQAANEEVCAFFRRLAQVVGHYAWVETAQAGLVVGRTAVSWMGDVDTVWPARLDTGQAALHERAVEMALRSRDTLLRLFVVVATGAVQLATLLAMPGGAILALPAAWRFINRVRTLLHDI